MTLSIMTFSMTTLSITTFGMMTFTKIIKNARAESNVCGLGQEPALEWST